MLKSMLEVNMPDKIQSKAIEYIIKIPQLFIAFVVSFLSGHIWTWLIYSYLKDNQRGAAFLKNTWAKTALGGLWNVLFLLPSYFLKFGFETNIDEKLFSVLIFAVLLGFAIQALILVMIISLKK